MEPQLSNSSEPITVFAYQVQSDIEYLLSLLSVSFQTTSSDLGSFNYPNEKTDMRLQEIKDLQDKLMQTEDREKAIIAHAKEREQTLSGIPS